MRRAPNVKTTGKVPTKAMDQNCSYDDYLNMTIAHCLWSGCLDAPISMPAGSVRKFSQHDYSMPYAAVSFRDGVSHA
jgi:hypothetical protein